MAKLLETVDLVTNFYTYEGVVKALNGVSIVVDSGATFGLVGESGCGKSVTVRSVMRIVQDPGQIEGGQVLVFFDEENKEKGLDLLKQSTTHMESLRGDQISMIFQEPNAALNPTFSIGEQVGESFWFHRQKELYRTVCEKLKNGHTSPWAKLVKALCAVAARDPDAFVVKLFSKLPLLNLWRRPVKAEVRRRCEEIIAKLGIPDPRAIVDQYPHNLSGGMKQRIVIAMALACNPVLLIADEATSNLDVTIQAQILELLRQLKQEVISSVLLITHDLGVVAETCDRVGVMYAGNLCEVADVEAFFANPLHPYSRALLDSVPKYKTIGELRSIEGAVPNLVTPPDGCRFHPRCPKAMDVCAHKLPPMREHAPGHSVACHLFADRG
jgi:peptide/nickel transport system ATP-binding protein